MIEPRRLTLYIEPQYAGKSVDTLLRHVLHLSGSGVRRAKRISNGITLDGSLVYTNVLAQEGQTLSVQVGDSCNRQAVAPKSGPTSIVYEDEDLIVLDKNAPLPVHPSMGHPNETLANYVMYYYQTIGLLAEFHPVNRLDRGTSGLMVVAKHAHAHERLSQTLHSGSFQREYLAVCEGVPSPMAGRIDAPIGRIPGSVLLREVRADGASACTQYQVKCSDSRRSLVSLKLETGRTHQIRVHMQSIGCPLVGDFLYGEEVDELPGRVALHAAQLELLHPISGKQLSFTSPLPSKLSALLSAKSKEG